MSQENVELTRRTHDAFNCGDAEAFIALMAEDVEAVPRIVGTLGQTVHGHEGVRRWWQELFEVVPDLTVEIVAISDHGDVTLAEALYRGHGAASHTPFATESWLVWRWRDGRCVFWASKPSQAEALGAVGLAE